MEWSHSSQLHGASVACIAPQDCMGLFVPLEYASQWPVPTLDRCLMLHSISKINKHL